MRINSVTTKEKKQDLWRKFLGWRMCTELKKGGSSPVLVSVLTPLKSLPNPLSLSRTHSPFIALKNLDFSALIEAKFSLNCCTNTGNYYYYYY